MSARRAFAIDLEELKALANAQAEALAAELLPNGRRDGPYWRTGSIADEPGQSLAVTLQGADRGMWCDHAASGPQGGGNLLQLAAWTRFGGAIVPAIEWMISRLGLDGLDPGRLATVRAKAAASARDSAAEHAREAERKRRMALSLYLNGRPIADTPVEIYLKGRGIDLRALGHAPGCLAWHPEIWNGEAQRKLPCMLAAAVDLDGRHIATHRTWLAPDGKGGWDKAGLEDPKMTIGSSLGGFIPLWRSAADRRAKRSMAHLLPGTDVYVSEGIEDGLTAAMARPELRIVCAIALRKIGPMRLPEAMGRLYIIGQRDTHPKTLAALEDAISRQQEAGRDVWLTPPPKGFKDVNDALRADQGMAA